MANHSNCSATLTGENVSKFIFEISPYITEDNTLLILEGTENFNGGVGYHFYHKIDNENNSLTLQMRGHHSAPTSFLSFFIKENKLSGTIVDYDMFSDFFHYTEYKNGEIITQEYSTYICKRSVHLFGLLETISEEVSLGVPIENIDINNYIDMGFSTEEILEILEKLKIDKSNDIFEKVNDIKKNGSASDSEIPF
jgi:hypothetical protein